MTDAENATKAPESDAQEQAEPQTEVQAEQKQETIIPGDTPAQTGPSTGVGEHCVTDRPTRVYIILLRPRCTRY